MRMKKRIISIILSVCCLLGVFQVGLITNAYLIPELELGKTYSGWTYDFEEASYALTIEKPKTVRITITSTNGDPIDGFISKYTYTKRGDYEWDDYETLVKYETSSSVSYILNLEANEYKLDLHSDYKHYDYYDISVYSSDFTSADFTIKVEDITPSVSLSSTKYTYNGKVHKPTVTVKDAKGKKMKNGTDYSLKYSNSSSKKPGEYSVKISYKGKYKGIKSVTYKYTIAPRAVKGLKVSSTAKKTAKITFTKATGATGYVVYYSTKKSSGFKKLTTTSKTSVTNKKLKSGKTYYFKVKTYTKVSSSKKLYSTYSKTVSKKIK